MTTALLVLSPLEAHQFTHEDAADLAVALKAQGVTRVDIACDPRHSELNESVARGYPTPDFDRYAGQLRDLIFRHIIGKCDVVDVARFITHPKTNITPSAANFANAGQAFSKTATTADAKNAGALMYAAIHQRMALRNVPRIIIWPNATSGLCSIFDVFKGQGVQETSPDNWGTRINLGMLRACLNHAYRASPINTVGKTLHA